MWVAQLVLIAYLPGALLYRLPVAARERRAALPAEERAFWAVVLSVAWSSVLTLALAAAARYSLVHLVSGNAALCAVLLLAGRRHLLFGGSAAPPTWHAAAPALLILLGAWLYFPPAEYIIGGKDPGTYVNEGVALAQRGAMIVDDPLVPQVPAFARDIFFPSYRNPTYYSNRFMGFFLVNPLKGVVVGQFPHLYPAWIAIGYGLAGLTGALAAVGWWAILGLVAVYLAGARLVGRLTSFAGAAVLAVALVTTWFARYPNSEVVMQALLFAALLAYARSHVDDDPFFAPVAGVLLGLLPFLRFDSVLAWGAVGITAVLLTTLGRRPRLAFVVPAVLGAALGWMYYSRWMRPYAERPLIFVQSMTPGQVALLGAGLAALALVLVAARHPAVGPKVRAWVPPGAAAVMAVAAVYAYFFRHAAGRLAAHDADSLRTFTWYFPAPALLAAAAGFALLARKRFWRDPALMVTAAVYALFVFYKIRIVPDHFWMARRFIPVILPASCLLMSAGVFYAWWSRPTPLTLSPASWRREWRSLALSLALPTAFATAVGVAFVRAAEPVRSHVEYAGIVPKVEALARRFDDRDLLLVEARRSSDLHVLALPLAYIYGCNVLVFATPRPDPDAFRDFLLWARRAFREVYFAGGGGMDLLSRHVSVVPVASEQFQVPEYESRRNAFPYGVRHKEFDFSLYRFIEAEVPPGPIVVDVGTHDDLYVVRFHAKERMGDITYRWSTNLSYVSIVGIRPGASTLTVWMGDGNRRVSEVGTAHVALSIDGRPIGETDVTGPFRPYSFPLPPDLVEAAARRDAPALVRLTSTTFNLQKLAGIPDDRNLGVMVDRVAVQ